MTPTIPSITPPPTPPIALQRFEIAYNDAIEEQGNRGSEGFKE